MHVHIVIDLSNNPRRYGGYIQAVYTTAQAARKECNRLNNLSHVDQPFRVAKRVLQEEK